MKLDKVWQRNKVSVSFALWGLALAVVCFLLCRALMNSGSAFHHYALTDARRAALMTVVVPDSVKDVTVSYGAFDVHFNSVWGIANYAAYELTLQELDGEARRSHEFVADTAVAGCPQPGDYRGSGMDRGHLVPAGDLKWNEKAMSQSFLMTNICPMAKTLNEGGWARLEEKVREWAQRDSALLVFTGPVVTPADTTLIGKPVRVPGAYFKVIMAPCVRPMRVIAFIYPNGRCQGRLSQYAVSVDEVEARTGLDFFPSLAQELQQRLEGMVCLDAWLN